MELSGRMRFGEFARLPRKAYRLGTAFWREKPSFFIVGTQKGGTSTFYKYLATHPQIAAAYAKEVHYYDQNCEKNDLWYRAHFPLQDRQPVITGEATPAYMYWPNCIPTIAEHWPQAKIITILRDPVERAISHYFHEKRNGRENRSMLAAFQGEDSLSRYSSVFGVYNGNIPYRLLHYSYLDRGRYKRQIQRIYQYFAAEQVVIFESGSFFRNPNETLQQAAAFLGLDSDYHFADVKPTHVGGYDDSSIDSEAYEYLVDQFRAENDKLFDYMGYPFEWIGVKRPE